MSTDILREAISQIRGEIFLKERGFTVQDPDINAITEWACAKLGTLIGEKTVMIKEEEVTEPASPNCRQIIALTREILMAVRKSLGAYTKN